MNEKTLWELKEDELKESFIVMVKNRNYLCDKKGVMLPEYRRQYMVPYTDLLNKVGTLLSEVISDSTVRLYYIPNTDNGRKCIEEIKKLYEKTYYKGMKKIIESGTWNDLLMFRNSFQNKAVSIYIQYCNDSKEIEASLRSVS